MTTTGDGCAFADCTAGYNHLITTLRPPSTVMLCDEHYPAGLIPLLAAELGVDPTGLYAHIEKFLKSEARKADKAVADVQAAEAAKDSGSPGLEGYETFHDVGRDLRAERKHGDGGDGDIYRMGDVPGDVKSMADIIPEDWSGETL